MKKKYMFIKDETLGDGRNGEITTDTYILLMYIYNTVNST